MEVAESRRCMNLKRNIGGLGKEKSSKAFVKRVEKKNEG